MRQSRFALVLAICSSIAAAFSATIAQAIAALDRFGRFMLDAIAPAGKPLALAGMPSAPMSISGHALERSTQESLRHEAGTARRSAPRNI